MCLDQFMLLFKVTPTSSKLSAEWFQNDRFRVVGLSDGWYENWVLDALNSTRFFLLHSELSGSYGRLDMTTAARVIQLVLINSFQHLCAWVDSTLSYSTVNKVGNFKMEFIDMKKKEDWGKCRSSVNYRID